MQQWNFARLAKTQSVQEDHRFTAFARHSECSERSDAPPVRCAHTLFQGLFHFLFECSAMTLHPKHHLHNQRARSERHRNLKVFLRVPRSPRLSHACRMPTTSSASTLSRQTTNNTCPMYAFPNVNARFYFATITPCAVFGCKSSKKGYSPGAKALMTTKVVTPGATTFSFRNGILSNSAALPPAFVISILMR